MLNSTSRTYDSTAMAALLAAFKASLRITASDMDTELTRELKAAVLYSENFVGYRLVKSSFALSASFDYSIVLQAPVISVTTVLVDGVSLDSSKYSLKEDSLIIDSTVERGSTVTVQYTAGLINLPEDIEQAIFLRAAYAFNSPVDSVDQRMTASIKLLRPHRLFK